jgi:DNA end-binding protein Ku
VATIWRGSIVVGLVNVPVELRTAVREERLSFRLLHKEDNTPVKFERVRSDTRDPVAWNDIVKGYEYSKGQFITMTDQDFKDAAVEQNKSIELERFVQFDDIDPRFYETAYYLTPSKGAERSYALLREAMRESNVAGFGRIILRQSQHLALIRVLDEALIILLLRWANELVKAEEYSFPDANVVKPAELELAVKLLSNLSGAFEPEAFEDEYTANLQRIIKAKAKGQKIDLEAPERNEPEPKVLDLMTRLRESLEQNQAKGERGTAERGTRKRSARSSESKPAARRTRKRQSA